MAQNKTTLHSRLRTGMKIVICLTVLAGIFFSLFSSTAVEYLWLPRLARAMDCSFSVEDAAFYLFRRGPNFFVRKLMLKDSRGNTIFLDSGEARILPGLLFFGTADLDLVRLAGADIHISGDVPISEGPSPLLSGNLRIGAVDMIDSKIHLEIPGKPYREIRISSAVLSGLIPESGNHLAGKISIYPEGDKSENPPHFSLQTDISFTMNQKFRFKNISGSVSISNGTGIWNNRSLTGLGGTVFFDANEREAEGPLNLKLRTELSGVDCTDTIQMEGGGLWDLRTGDGSLDLNTFIRFSDTRAHELYFPETIGIRIFPENLHLSSGTLSMRWNRETLSWTSDGEIKADKLWVQDTKSIPDGTFRFHHAMSYSFPTGELSVKELDNRLSIGSAAAEFKNDGIFTFSRGKDNGYHVKANNSSLVFRVHSLPAKLLNSLFPFDFSDGEYSLDYKITANSQEQKLTGNMSFLIRGAAFDDAGKRKIKPQDVFADFSFHSNGLENITGLIVDKCTMDVYAEDKKHILQAELSGSWKPDSNGLTLSGQMDLNPFEAAGRMCDPLADDFRALLLRHKAEKTEYHCSVQMDWDPHRTKRLSFDVQTKFDTMAFLESGIKTPLNINVSGCVLRNKNTPESSVRFDAVKIQAPELIDASADGRLSLPGGQSEFRIAVSRLSPAVIRGILRLFAREDFSEEQVASFYWQSFSAETSFSFDPEGRIFRITPFRIVMVPDPEKSLVSLSLDRDFICFLDDPSKTEAAMTLILENLPLKWFTFFLPSDGSYKFLSGTATGSADVTVRNNGTDIFLDHDFMVENYSFAVGDTVWHAGDCRVGGKSYFKDNFTSYDLLKTSFHCMEGTHRYMSMNVDGSLALTPEGKTFYEFSIEETSERFPEKLFGEAAKRFIIKESDITGKIRYDGNEDFSRNSFTMNLGIRSLDPDFGASRYEPRPLHGSVQLDLDSEPGIMHVNKAGIQLKDQQQKTVFDLQAAGTLIPAGENGTAADCHISSRGIDGEYLIRAMTATARESSSVPENGPPEPVSHNWPFREEPGKISFYGWQTNLTANLHNITLTDHVRMSLSGKIQAAYETLQASDLLLNINDSAAHGSLKIKTAADNGCEYEGTVSTEKLDISKLVLALAELKEADSVMKNLRGIIRNLKFSVQGKGISLQNLDRFLNMKLYIDAENLSVPFDAGTTVVLLRILLLPIQQIPRLVEILPQSILRDFLRTMVGESMDIYSGYRNVDFSRGTLELESRGTDLHVRKMYFSGPQIRTRVQRGWFNPFYNEIDIESLTVFSGMALPFHFTGKLDDPQIGKTYFIGDFLKYNTINAGEKTIHLLSLGQANPDNETVWSRPAEFQPVAEEQKQKRISSRPQ